MRLYHTPHHVFSIILALILALTFSVDAQSDKQEYGKVLDINGLPISQNNGNQKFMIMIGDLIKIYAEKDIIKAHLSQITDSHIILNKNENDYAVPLDEIKKIRWYRSSTDLMVGQSISIVGYASLSLSAMSLIVGGISVSQQDFGAILLIAVIPLAAMGYGLVELGNFIQRKTFHLNNNKWYIDLGIDGKAGLFPDQNFSPHE